MPTKTTVPTVPTVPTAAAVAQPSLSVVVTSSTVGAVASTVVTPQLPATSAPPVPASEPPTTTVVEAAVAAPSEPSRCRADQPGAVMTIVMSDISYSCSVYAGGQSVLNQGLATLVTDEGSGPLLATHPGRSGTLWIAGHRSSHGGPFADVPDLADGAIITVADESRTASYRVVGRAHVKVRGSHVVDASGHATEAATQAAILRPDLGGALAPRLVLQTCDTNGYFWVIYADLITG
jgi:sortase A